MSYIGAQPTTAAFVTDTFSANGSGTVFTLSVAPANTNSILVAVSGVLQDPSTYSVSGTTLTFSAAPPAGTGNISVRFLGIPASGVVNTAYRTQTEFTATAGQTTFSVPSYTVGFIDVYRNGALLGSADFTATNGTTVVLANPASSGDLVETVSFFVSSVLNAVPTTGGTFSGNVLFASGNGIWNTSGNVGVGTSSPGYKLQVNRTGNGAAARFTNGSTIIDLWNDSTSSYIGDAGAVNALEVNTASNSATLNTNNSQRLLIDSSGRVTTPFQPGIGIILVDQVFSAATSGFYKPTTYTTTYNVGGGFNPTGGPSSSFRYTAPIAGRYFIQWSVMGNDGGNRLEVCVLKNGGDFMNGDTNTSKYANAIVASIQYLAASDYLDFRINQGDYYSGVNSIPCLSIHLIG